MFLGLPGICLCVAQTVTIFDKFKILASCPNLRIRDDSEIANFWHCKSKYQPFLSLTCPGIRPARNVFSYVLQTLISLV